MEKDVDVLILGAGVAGIAAARTLQRQSNSTFLVLEADYKLGGRVQNQPMVNTKKDEFIFVPSGAHWLLGMNNPLYEYAKMKQLIKKETSNDDMGIFYTENGEEIDQNVVADVMEDVGEILEKAGDFYKHKIKGFPANLNYFLTNEFERRITRKPDSNLRRQILDWHKRYYIIDSGASSLDQLSAKEWGRFEHQEQHITLKGGLAGLLKTMSKEIGEEKFLKHKFVHKIQWAANFKSSNQTRKVVVQCKDGSIFSANKVIVTFSLGILKQNFGHLFLPKIPTKHRDSIECLGYGSMSKIFLQFESKWWEGSGIHFIFKNSTSYEDAPWTRWFLGFKVYKSLKNTLVGWIGGDGVQQIEKLTDFEVIEDTLRLLYRFTRKNIPYPKRFFVSRWPSNSLTRGTFSYASVQCDASDLTPKDLAEPITTNNKEFSYLKGLKLNQVPVAENVLLFAGEGCSNKHFSTAHGAYLSGEEQAIKVMS